MNFDCSERGLLSMAFDPDYATTGRFWVYYTSRPQASPAIANGDIVVEGYLRSGGNPDVADTTRTLLLPSPTPAPTTTAGTWRSVPTVTSTSRPETAAAAATAAWASTATAS